MLRIWIVTRDAGGGDGFAPFDAGGDFLVEGEELGEEVGLRREGEGGEDGGIEGGVGVFERVCAGEFEGAVDGAQTAFHFRQCLGADAAHFAAGGGDRFDLHGARRLRPGEGIEDGTRSIGKPLC